MRLDQVGPRIEAEDRRCAECPMRARGQCLIVNELVRWQHGMPLEDCNICWSLGGPSSAEAEKWRAEYAHRTVLHFSDPERLVVLPTRVRNAIASHVEGGEDLQEVPPPVDEGLVGRASHFARSLLSRGGPLNRKVELTIKGARHISCFGTDLDGTRVQAPCPSLTRLEGGHHVCSDCGCGDGPRAWLDTDPEYDKLDYPYLWCPRGRQGFSYPDRTTP